MWNNVWRSVKLSVVLIFLLGIVYPMLMALVAGSIFPYQANGSIIYLNGVPVGSELIGQKFTGSRWFHGRPSYVDYNPLKSGGSNLALSNPALEAKLKKNIEEVIKENPGIKKLDIPVDLITASASGLDPDISVDAAYIQARRVAQANGLDYNKVKELIDKNIEKSVLGIFGQPRVNVLKLNLALYNLVRR
ncbi:potassium-transporting ATPase subunit KdpC [Caldanaerobius polysaccharolyticus]|uniref:potassium-transporting ATPase subunit KdpC n=1 Tax=Caldanaerobius polysaccharolyticus TaxID=44256 RepID=UPI00047AC038|nr:potassium-transporting ATPase subunit KdpC [Caldanaerobius polysaccharolyticus]